MNQFVNPSPHYIDQSPKPLSLRAPVLVFAAERLHPCGHRRPIARAGVIVVRLSPRSARSSTDETRLKARLHACGHRRSIAWAAVPVVGLSPRSARSSTDETRLKARWHAWVHWGSIAWAAIAGRALPESTNGPSMLATTCGPQSGGIHIAGV